MSYVLLALLILIGIFLFRRAVDRTSLRNVARLVLLLLAVVIVLGILAVRSLNS